MAEKKNGLEGDAATAQGGTPVEKLSENEAVRRALALLGQKARLADLQAHIKERLGLDMEPDRISAIRSDIIRKVTAKKPAPRKPDDNTGTEGPARNEPARDALPEIPSKMEAVRQALRALGEDAKPRVIQEYLQQRFDLGMSRDHISVYKSDLKRKLTRKPQGRATPAAPPVREPATPAPKAPGKGDIGLEDLLVLKKLVERVGATKLLGLVDALSK
jgi:hypothetical protein